MADYLLYGETLIADDSTLNSFAKSLCNNFDLHYSGDSDYEEWKEYTLDYIEESILDDISRTDIDYEDLMYKYRSELGNLFYEMDNNGFDLGSFTLSFFGDEAQKSFELLLNKYIMIHFEELTN